MDPACIPKAQSSSDKAPPGQQFEWLEDSNALVRDSASGAKPLVCTPISPWSSASEVLGSRNQQTLHFVTESGRARPKGTSRHIIRSQARRKRNTHVITSSSVPSFQIQSNDKAKGQASPDPQTQAQALQSDEPELKDLTLHYGHEIGTLEPFDSLPVIGHPNVYSLLAHFDKIVRHCRGIPGPREGWLSFAITDGAVLSTILFISALDIAGLCGKAENSDILYWKGQTIRIINQRLTYHKHMATDGTIAAVACLSHLENLVGTAESAKIHAEALDIMVSSRGGLQNLGFNGMPRRIVSWADIATSIILKTKPRYQAFVAQEERDKLGWGLYSPLALLYKTKLMDFTGSTELSEATIDIYWDLRNLARLKETDAFLVNEGDVIEKVPFTDTADLLERRIVTLTQLEPLSSPTMQLSIITLFGYAALVHMYLFMRDCSKDLPFSHMLSSRIRTVLEMVDIERLQEAFPEMMLWILIMGGLSGSPLLERVWFARRMVEFCQMLGLSGGHQIAAMLDDFFWSELYRSPVTRRFWQQVAKADGSEGVYEVRRLADHVSVTCFNAPPDFND